MFDQHKRVLLHSFLGNLPIFLGAIEQCSPQSRWTIEWKHACVYREDSNLAVLGLGYIIVGQLLQQLLEFSKKCKYTV